MTIATVQPSLADDLDGSSATRLCRLIRLSARITQKSKALTAGIPPSMAMTSQKLSIEVDMEGPRIHLSSDIPNNGFCSTAADPYSQIKSRYHPLVGSRVDAIR